MPAWDVEPLQLRLRWDAFALGGFLRTADSNHLLTEMPGNIGDHLIACGTDAFLADQINVTPVPVRDVAAHEGGGRLLVPGSGALTRDWHEWLPDLVVEAAQRFDDVVLLPSELHPDVPEVARMLECTNVFPIAREMHSYRAALPFGRAAFALDLALHCPGFDPTFAGRTHPSNGRTLVALRTDKSSNLAAVGLQIDTAENVDISVAAQGLDGFLDEIRSAERVVTDRLHVLVTAVMSGVPVDYVDATNDKLSRYVGFTFGPDAAHLLHRVDHRWLLERRHVRESV